MKLTSAASAAIAFLLLSALILQAQNVPAPGSRTGVVNLRDCMDKSKNQWIGGIEQELQKLQEAESGRATDLNPQERARIRTKISEFSNKRKFEVYTEVVRLSGIIARERGFDLVQRADRMPEGGDADLNAQIERRDIVHFDPSLDITNEILDRMNKEYAARKK